jgi:hypothetical protein
MLTSLIFGLVCLVTLSDSNDSQEKATAVESPAATVASETTGSVPSTQKSNENPSATTDSTTSNGVASEVTPADTAATSTDNGEQWLLRYKFQPGQKLRYEMEQTMTLEAMVSEKKESDRSELKQRRQFTVLSTDEDGAAHLTMQFEHVWMLKKVDDRDSVVFDSGMKPDEVPAAFRQVAHDLKGVAPKYWLSAIGTSLRSGENNKIVKASAEVSGKGDSERKSAETANAETAGTNNDQKNASDPGSFLMQLPETPVKVGDSWKETIVVPVRLPHDINVQIPILRTSRLESVKDGVALISFRCSIESGSRNPLVRSQLIQATPRGETTFDINRGVMLRREMRYDESVFGVLGAESVISSVGRNVEVLLEEPVAK